jgi:hypothetical protein
VSPVEYDSRGLRHLTLDLRIEDDEVASFTPELALLARGLSERLRLLSPGESTRLEPAPTPYCADGRRTSIACTSSWSRTLYAASSKPPGTAEDARRVLLGPPEFVDQPEEGGGRTVGAVLRIYAAFDEAGRLLDEARDRAALEDARALIEGLMPVSAESGIDIGFELDQDSVGWIENGELGESLRVGLLEAWAARFA